mgnify:CR=1 FL=1
MKENRTIVLPDKIEQCHELIKRQAERIAWLEQRLFGSKKDRSAPYDGPTLFDEYFKLAEKERVEAIKQASAEVEAHAAKRRAAAKKPAKNRRPEKYQYSGLREQTTVKYPEGINLDEYDVIGKDTTRLLHYQKAELWVECIEHPCCARNPRETPSMPESCRLPRPRRSSGATTWQPTCRPSWWWTSTPTTSPNTGS